MERNAPRGDGTGSGYAVAAMHQRRPDIRRRRVCELAGAAFSTFLAPFEKRTASAWDLGKVTDQDGTFTESSTESLKAFGPRVEPGFPLRLSGPVETPTLVVD